MFALGENEVFIAFLRKIMYTILVNCGASLRSVLRGVGCVQPSFLFPRFSGFLPSSPNLDNSKW